MGFYLFLLENGEVFSIGGAMEEVKFEEQIGVAIRRFGMAWVIGLGLLGGCVPKVSQILF